MRNIVFIAIPTILVTLVLLFQNCSEQLQQQASFSSTAESFIETHSGTPASLCTGTGDKPGRHDVFNFRTSSISGVAHWTHIVQSLDMDGNVISAVPDSLTVDIRDALGISHSAEVLTLAQCREICQRVFKQASTGWTSFNCWLHQDQNYGTANRYINSLNIFWLENESVPYGSADCEQAYEVRQAPQTIAHVRCTSKTQFQSMANSGSLLFNSFTAN